MAGAGPNFFSLLALGMSLLLAALDQTVVAAVIPSIASDLRGIGQYTLVYVSYLVSSSFMLPVGGLMLDRWGRKKTMAAGLTGFVLSSVWCGDQFLSAQLSPMSEFIAARFVQGACAGIILSSVFVIIADLYSPAQRGRYQGLFAAIWALASLIGPYAGGWLSEHLGWRWVFLVNVPMGMLALQFLFLAPLPEASDAWRHPYNAKEIAGLFLNSTIIISLISVFVSGMGMYGGMALMPLVFHVMFRAGPQRAGELLSLLVSATCLFSVAGGLALSKFKRYKALVISGFTVMAAGTFALAGISLTSITAVQACLVVAGAGLGLLLPVYTVVIQSVAPQQLLGVATGVSQFTRCAGGAAGACTIGAVLAQHGFNDACSILFLSYGALLGMSALLNLALPNAVLRRRSPTSSTYGSAAERVPAVRGAV